MPKHQEETERMESRNVPKQSENCGIHFENSNSSACISEQPSLYQEDDNHLHWTRKLPQQILGKREILTVTFMIVSPTLTFNFMFLIMVFLQNFSQQHYIIILHSQTEECANHNLVIKLLALFCCLISIVFVPLRIVRFTFSSPCSPLPFLPYFFGFFFAAATRGGSSNGFSSGGGTAGPQAETSSRVPQAEEEEELPTRVVDLEEEGRSSSSFLFSCDKRDFNGAFLKGDNFTGSLGKSCFAANLSSSSRNESSSSRRRSPGPCLFNKENGSGAWMFAPLQCSGLPRFLWWATE